MVVLLVSICVLEAALLFGVGLYAESLELRKRMANHPGPPAIHSTRH